ncbi:MAG: hypothetical protein HY809_04725 [Nitrospirae bacterium]|nr:hypothetical protein [Nitrospirota bacterium]
MEYEGTVLLVSHDREFLNNIVTSTIVFEGNGRVEEYVGGYDDWLRQRKPAVPEKTEKPAKPQKPRQKQERPRILTFKEKKELEALPALIESLEMERDGLYESLSNPEFYKQDGSRIPEIKTRIGELEIEITEAYKRWEVLEAILKSVSV